MHQWMTQQKRYVQMQVNRTSDLSALANHYLHKTVKMNLTSKRSHNEHDTITVGATADSLNKLMQIWQCQGSSFQTKHIDSAKVTQHKGTKGSNTFCLIFCTATGSFLNRISYENMITSRRGRGVSSTFPAKNMHTVATICHHIYTTMMFTQLQNGSLQSRPTPSYFQLLPKSNIHTRLDIDSHVYHSSYGTGDGKIDGRTLSQLQ